MWTILFLLFFLILIASPMGLILGLIKPRWVRLSKRSQSALVFISLFFVGLLGTALTASQVATSTHQVETSVESAPDVEKDDARTSERMVLDFAGVGGSLDYFRQQYGKESSIIEETDTLIIGAHFGPVSASFENGICLSISETTGELSLTTEEALEITEQFLPPDAEVVEPLYKGLMSGDLEGLESYTLVQTYFSTSLAEISHEADFEGWPSGSIATLLTQDTSAPGTIIYWEISTHQPHFLQNPKK